MFELLFELMKYEFDYVSRSNHVKIDVIESMLTDLVKLYDLEKSKIPILSFYT